VELSELALCAERVIANVERVIFGKRETVRLALIGILSQGHLLIEDAPGVGKTVLAKALAYSLGLSFKRIQFTPDLLPSDVTGTSTYDLQTGAFGFRPGPVFANIVLADEINRASPKTQSALLECMEETQVTTDGTTRPLPQPFLVMATQNPVEFEGIYPLPESQLDRFLFRLRIGYPTLSEERAVLKSQRLSHPIESLTAVLSGDELIAMQQQVRQVHLADEVYDLRGTAGEPDPRAATRVHRRQSARLAGDCPGGAGVRGLEWPRLRHPGRREAGGAARAGASDHHAAGVAARRTRFGTVRQPVARRSRGRGLAC